MIHILCKIGIHIKRFTHITRNMSEFNIKKSFHYSCSCGKMKMCTHKFNTEASKCKSCTYSTSDKKEASK